VADNEKRPDQDLFLRPENFVDTPHVLVDILQVPENAAVYIVPRQPRCAGESVRGVSKSFLFFCAAASYRTIHRSQFGVAGVDQLVERCAGARVSRGSKSSLLSWKSGCSAIDDRVDAALSELCNLAVGGVFQHLGGNPDQDHPHPLNPAPGSVGVPFPSRFTACRGSSGRSKTSIECFRICLGEVRYFCSPLAWASPANPGNKTSRRRSPGRSVNGFPSRENEADKGPAVGRFASR